VRHSLNITFFIIIIGLSGTLAAQSFKEDSLLNILKTLPSGEKAEAFINLANFYGSQREFEKLIQAADSAIYFSILNQNQTDEANAYALKGRVYFLQRNYPLAAENYDKEIELRRLLNNPKSLAQTQRKAAEVLAKIDANRALQIANESLLISQEMELDEEIAQVEAVIGLIEYSLGNYGKALKSWENALRLYKELDNKIEYGVMLTNISAIYRSWGDYQKAIQFNLENLNLQEEIGDTSSIAKVLGNMGNIYFYMGVDYDRALDYYKRSLELFEYKKDRFWVAQILNNIGLVYLEKEDMGEALQNYNRALRIFKELNFKPGIAASQNYIGNVYLEGGNFEEALRLSREALAINQEIGNRREMASNLRDIGRVYFRWGKFTAALDYYNKSLALNSELGHKKEVFEIYKNISEVYKKESKFDLALNYFERYSEGKDSSISEEYLNQISELETKYETEKKERELELERTESARNLALLQKRDAEVKRQRLLIYSFIMGLIMILVFSSILYKQFRQKQRANILLAEQNNEIKSQRDQIYQQKQEITDSIHYASRIQKAILPPLSSLESKLDDHFILYLPRDIVSGDYYWYTMIDNQSVIIAADCTGHGVPGAFMSMLGVSFLNEIVIKNKITKPSEILNMLRKYVVESLHQTGKEGEAQDGMDMAVVKIDHSRFTAEYAGAYNPLFFFRDDEFQEIRADKMPIGIHSLKSDDFTNHELNLQKGDTLYLFSDGYMDQFGGPKGKKFMAGQFKSLLQKIHKEKFAYQAEILINTFDDWKGNIEQIDDILVIGLKM
jgi:serine phosphatase RsbU (regulator of sigma subunit)